ncbi:hypothetical protein [Streptomyces sp. LNU-CPARS28]|uniref:hypothetical protein n=1 Tax=Streptomyces sp. LNU-CPARS28 TaxID=3137371 RepID=UPI0031373FA0
MTALACRAVALALAVGAAYTGHQDEVLPTLGLAYGAVLFAWFGRCESAADRHDRVQAQRAEMAARPRPARPHTPRPPAGPGAQDGVPLNSRENALFADIAAHYDHGTTA